jgi:predicted SnoaL-like aldol condensation-catalyzing enzyme
MKKEYLNKSIELVRCIAEGDLVSLHTPQIWSGNDEYETMDFTILIKMVKHVNIGTLFSKFQSILQTQIKYIEFLIKNYLLLLSSTKM